MKSVLFGLFLVFSSSLKIENHQNQDSYTVTESKLNADITKKLKINLDEDGRISVSGGCNFFTTEYQFQGSYFRVQQDWISTRMYCFNDHDRQIQQAFNSVTQGQRSSQRLILKDGDGNQVFVLKKI